MTQQSAREDAPPAQTAPTTDPTERNNADDPHGEDCLQQRETGMDDLGDTGLRNPNDVSKLADVLTDRLPTGQTQTADEVAADTCLQQGEHPSADRKDKTLEEV